MTSKEFIRSLYYISKRLYTAFSSFFLELTKPLAFVKGDDFEICLRQKVFTAENYDLVMKTHDFHANQKDYVESSLFPDYLFREKETGNEFWVEAKYRENLYNGKIEWCKPYQLTRYKKLSKEQKVIIAIGFGGRPRNPNKIYLVPLEQIKYTGLYPKPLTQFEFVSKRKNLLDSVMDKAYDYQND